MAKKPVQPASGRYRVGVYPGTFDPVTNGHLDIIGRAVKVVDKLVVGVAVNAGKGPLFTLKERVEMCRKEVAALKLTVPVEIVPFDTLLMDFVVSLNATVIIRGLRAVSDFEYEFQMACMNHHLAPSVETVFLMTAQEYFYVSSSLVKEVATFGGDVTPFLPEPVRLRLAARLAQRTP